ncbi:MAG: cell surface protein SprA [Paludibacteraceae bacterium]|nr:cell surface protein SprA [Paludibacteraceae bacterium]
MRIKTFILLLIMPLGLLAQEIQTLPNMPDNTTSVVEYQPSTGYYVVHTRIGNLDVTTPCLMSPDEYKAYSEKQFIHRYWQQKISEVEHDNEKKFDITDMKFNIGPADKVFGPGGVQLKLQGSAELLFGFKHQYVDNPSLTLRSRNNNIFDFDEKIQLNVNGAVGTRLGLQMNYNTEASFAADQQNVKIAYKGEEDDIIQSIQAGNVTLDLNSSLIKGSQALFGIKTELKFGRLSVQGLISQQNSQTQSASSEGGAQMTKFEVQADNYDENKHFFLGYYFRDNYENAMRTLPYVTGGITINRIEVWVTNKRAQFDQARNIIAFADLGEGHPEHLLDTYFRINDNKLLPYNGVNELYGLVKDQPEVRDIQSATSWLQGQAQVWSSQGHDFTGGEDYDKIESARLLSPSEYTLNAALGYISLKSALQQDEVLAVAYEYTYGGKVYQVGEFSSDQNQSGDIQDGRRAPNLILKMLRSSNTAPIPLIGREKEHYGAWHLMMKNIYSLGASSMTAEKFELYVKYRNDSIGQEVQYLPEGQRTKGKQLIRVLNADRLDQRNNPYPDGRFDYVEGYTALSSMGRIIFPVLEPFGSHLAKQLDSTLTNKALIDKYCFQELYDSTLVVAQEMSEKNKFVLAGKYQGSNSSEIRLNAMNIPRGSVTVTAGGATLVENVDYTVDYTMGIVTILNQSLIEAGTNINVQLENQSTFGMQRKGLYGLHLQYDFSKDFSIGGTLMHLRETPLTTKVNAGSEPLANTIWGLNLAYKTNMMWLTNLLDKVPWITATAPSTFQIGAEFAHLIPGHTKDVGAEGTSYIDDFESTTTAIDVHYPSNWFLSSTPSRFAESNMSNNVEYGKNRALLNWYIVDPIFGHPQTNTPAHIKDDINALSDHRTRIVYQQELFPNKESLANEDTRLSILNLTLYPKERGPYNVFTGDGQYDDKGDLTNPASRWGGMMRRLDNTDFERANIEYIEFWLMDPHLTNNNFQHAKIYLNLGDVSEDILRDGKKSFEHGLPINAEDENMVETTVWGRVPRTTSTTIAFSNEPGARDVQDVGLDGLSTDQERSFDTYKNYAAHMRTVVTDATTVRRWQADPYSPFNDPAGDNYHYYRGDDYDEAQTSILNRYKHYNGTEGNSPESSGMEYGTASTLTPDIEDINHDNTLGEYEKYYEYEVDLQSEPGQELRSRFISEKMVTNVTLKNGNTEQVTWYKFKIPLKGDSSSCRRIGGIRNFKSIRFMRLYMTECEDTTTLRFATMDLVRGEWRNYTKGLYNDERNDLYNTTLPSSMSSLDVQAVSIEQDGKRSPVNYVLPPGISRQTDPGQAQLISQDEQALVLRVHDLEYNNARAVYKATTMDMRNYKQLKMFVHAEAIPGERELQDGELSCFIRLGTDMTSNYYEYEVPLSVTPAGTNYDNDNLADREAVWKPGNNIDFPFTALTNAKTARNKAKRSGDINVSNTKPYSIYDEANGKPANRITVMGNPTLEDVEYIVIGVRNRNGISTESKSTTLSGEVWVNELRLSEFNEEGGMAATANIGIGISDIAQLNMAGRVETAGFGSIESNVQNRNMDNYYQFQVSAALEAGRLFPEKAHLHIPLYASYSQNINSPKYDPTDTDIKLKESLETYSTEEEKDSIKNMANTVQTSTSWSLTNLKVDIHSKKKDMFYDPANFTVSVAYNKQEQRSPEIERDLTTEHRGSFNYSYSFNPKPWEPFKKIEKVQKAKILSEFNIYYLPQSWSFNTDMRRTYTELKMRDFNAVQAGEPTNKDMSYSKDFTWDRTFDFKYNLTKNMKFSFHTAMNSTVDEGLYTPEVIRDYNFSNDYYEAWRDTVRRSMKTWGTPYTYQQVFTATWAVPFNRIPYMDWLTANASYNGTYTWNRTAMSSSATNFGNTAQSSRSWQVDGQANFETLYGKSKYWKQLNQRMSGRTARRPFRPKTYSETVTLEKGKPIELTHNLNSTGLIITATDEKGKAVHIKFKANSDGKKVTITPAVSANNVTIAISSKNPNERTAAEQAMDFAAYFGTMIRRVQVTYRKTDALTVPGFYPQIGFFGQEHISGSTYAPGWDFAFGFYPSDYMDKARDNGWLALSDSISQPATMASTSDFDVKITLEPFPGFKVQVNGKRYEARSSSLLYAFDSQDRNNCILQDNMTGSYNITQVAIATAFERIGKSSDNFASVTFDRFLENRTAMVNRLEERYRDVYYPTKDPTGIFSDTLHIHGQKYDPSLGSVSRSSADVLVPAFLSAYTKRDIGRISFNPFMDILHVMPNWSVTFDGLGRIPAVKEHFKSFVLTHAYTCKYAIGAYSAYSTWLGAGDGSDKTVGFRRDAVTGMPVPSSAYDISSVSLTESFSPLIGVNMTLKNSLLIKTEYRKQRTATLNINSVQITEGHTDEIVVGTGYTVKDLHFTAKTKNGGQRKVSNDLKLTADFSYKNVATLLRKVEEGLTQASSGNKVWGLKISADYVISQKVNIQFYYDHQSTIPLISSSYPIKNDNAGINIKLMLTR